MSKRQASQGFTLIELLIVVVIIGILAAIAIPKFGATKERAFMAAMKSDLRNLATAQESYNYENMAYTTTFPASDFANSSGVSTPVITVMAAGWQGYVTHTGTSKSCAIFLGTVSLAPATTEGVPGCS